MFKTIFDLRRPCGPNKVPWTVVPQIGIFWLTQNPLFWELGIGARLDNFSHGGMTLRDPSGPRTPPKSICTHRHTRFKEIAKKSRFLDPDVCRASFGPHDILRSKMVLNMFFGPLTISYDAWMVSHTKLKKCFCAWKLVPKWLFCLRAYWPFTGAKLKALKEGL